MRLIIFVFGSLTYDCRFHILSIYTFDDTDGIASNQFVLQCKYFHKIYTWYVQYICLLNYIQKLQ